MEQVEGRLPEAIEAYKAVVTKAGSNKSVAAKAMLQMAGSYEKLGRPQARETYQVIVRDYADQPAVLAAARAKLAPIKSATQSAGVTPRLVSADAFVAGAISPDGRLAAGRDGVTGDLVLRSLLTKETKTLVSGIGLTGPGPGAGVFSPDGSRLLYSWLDRVPAQGGRSSLRLVATSGSADIRVLLTLDEQGAQLVPLGWSSNGQSMLARLRKASSDSIVAVSLGEPASVSTIKVFSPIPGAYRTLGKLSPDGAFVTCAVVQTTLPTSSAQSRIVVMDLASGAENEIVSLASSNANPVWTPDGSHVLFTSDRSGGRALWSVAVQAGKAVGDPVQVRTPFDFGLVGMSAAGDLYYAQTTQSSRQFVYIAERSVPGARVLQAFNGEGVAWSPDGSTLGFLKNEYAGPDHVALMTRRLATGEEHIYARPGGLGLQQVRWSPDGSALLVNAARANDQNGGFGGLYLFDLKTLQYKPVMPRPFQEQSGGIAELSPNLKTIYTYMRESPGQGSALVAFDIAGGDANVLYEQPSASNQSAGLAMSPDGRMLAVQTWADATTQQARLTLVNTDGSGSRNLYGSYPAPTVWSTLVWTPDNQSVLFVVGSRDAWRLMRVPAGGGEPVFDGLDSSAALADKSLPAFFGQVLSLTVSPDGSRVALGAYARPSQELWVFENVMSLVNPVR